MLNSIHNKMSFNPSLTYHEQGTGQEHVMFDTQQHIKSTLSNGQHLVSTKRVESGQHVM